MENIPQQSVLPPQDMPQVFDAPEIITSDETERQLLTKLIVLGSPILISIGIFDKYSDQGVGKIAFDQPRKVVSIYFG